MKKNKKYYSWEEIEGFIQKLSKWTETKNFKYLTGPPRGGLIPAVLLSHQTGLKYVSIGTAKSRPAVMRAKTLLVDDICDSGTTFLELEDYGFATASLIWRRDSEYLPDFHSETITDDSWIVFPWEKKDSETIQDYLVK
jgi:hypoxanthine phosphoribosyltransferase